MSHFIQNKPTGLLRLLLRAPLLLYRAGLGWLLGERFLMLHYVGYKSRLTRETVIEVIGSEKESDTYYVAAAWGSKSDWFRSVRSDPEVIIQVGKRKINAYAQILALEAAAQQLCKYAREHPAAFREISRLLTGKSLEGTNEECTQLAQTIPVIAFHAQRNWSLENGGAKPVGAE